MMYKLRTVLRCCNGFVCYKLRDVRFAARYASSYRNSTRQCHQWSYTHGVSDIPLRGVTIGNLLQEQTEKTPDREAVVFSSANIRKTFAQLLNECDRFAAGLSNLGLKRGDRVGIWGPNSIEWILTQYATARLGIILVVINPFYTGRELEFVLKKVQCKAVVSADEFQERKYYDILLELIPELANQQSQQIDSNVLPDLKHIIMMGDRKCPGTLQFSDVMEAASVKGIRDIFDLQKQLQFDDPIKIQFTSGTTGFPKGVTLSHHNIVNNSHFCGRVLGYHNRETRICIPVPLYHVFGSIMGSLMIPNHGATCVFPEPTFDAGTTLRAVAEERCTSLYGVPTMFIDMLNHADLDTFDLSSLYTGLAGATPCPIEVMRQIIQKLNMPGVTVAYGSTETSPTTFHSERHVEIEKRVNTSGRALPHTEGKVVNEKGDIVPVNTQGEIWTRGYTTMLGYWDDEDKTREVVRPDRWYKTGDLGVMDEDGFLRITGRKKDMIIRGGENVYPLEIEQVLHTHPKIKEAQVVGVPDERLGESICAWIRLKDSYSLNEGEVRAFCGGKLARFKVPKYIQFVTEFPLTASGKVQKFQIRESAIKSLSLSHISSSG